MTQAFRRLPLTAELRIQFQASPRGIGSGENETGPAICSQYFGFRLSNFSHRSRICQHLTVPHLIKKFPAPYASGRFITVFTKARHLTLS